ncbi:BCD family MFS transporter [Pseudorhodoferax sp. Leaf274]|uniref:BCD family MFS transporter n=1 Tax=Pseudorhodoferax sp. Leaf274 TaxID=1736318 RepID=UPI000703A98F|nr:BCD family MFS transporter [Pseudorhodoferax sp. Leaf274]KQP35374.1 bacteriochlorophyll synthase [Pseudorhodoferax sp. Leaf274]
MQAAPFGWSGILRLGLVQMALGAVVVLTTSTLNRVMVVELALPALLPGVLLALHYVVQVSRPRMGHGSDRTRRRTPWILGGMVALSAGGFAAALATVWMASAPVAGMVLAACAFVLIGLGVAAAGTALLALLASRVPPQRRAAAATTVWTMMIAGFAVTAGTAGAFLDPYTPQRLVAVAGVVALLALASTVAALWGLEGRAGAQLEQAQAAAGGFRLALREVWREADARRFTIFVFVAMLAFSAQDLIVEPFAGTVFGYSPGASTQLSGVQHGGTLLGMVLATVAGRRGFGSLRGWVLGGCVASALALLGLAAGGVAGAGWPLKANIFLLGAATGTFSIAAIGSMMRLAGQGRAGTEGLRMGLWGAAQALAFALGGLLGTGASDVARMLLADAGQAYATVFGLEALLFLAAAQLAASVEPRARPAATAIDELGLRNLVRPAARRVLP